MSDAKKSLSEWIENESKNIKPTNFNSGAATWRHGFKIGAHALLKHLQEIGETEFDEAEAFNFVLKNAPVLSDHLLSSPAVDLLRLQHEQSQATIAALKIEMMEAQGYIEGQDKEIAELKARIVELEGSLKGYEDGEICAGGCR